MAKLVKTAGLNDGTQGKRFSWGPVSRSGCQVPVGE